MKPRSHVYGPMQGPMALYLASFGTMAYDLWSMPTWPWAYGPAAQRAAGQVARPTARCVATSCKIIDTTITPWFERLLCYSGP